MPLSRGLVVISLHETELALDHSLAFQEQLAQMPPELVRVDAPPGLLSFWSWGLSHVLDYLEGLPAFEDRKIGLMGHSRRGKTAVLTAALDKRVAFVLAHQSGTLGGGLCSGTLPKAWKVLARFFRTGLPRVCVSEGPWISR